MFDTFKTELRPIWRQEEFELRHIFTGYGRMVEVVVRRKKNERGVIEGYVSSSKDSMVFRARYRPWSALNPPNVLYHIQYAIKEGHV